MPNICTPCSCLGDTSAMLAGNANPIYVRYATENVAEGCYDELSPMTSLIGLLYGARAMDIYSLAEPCDASTNPACLTGYCQSRNHSHYHPAFNYTAGCWSWHGGDEITQYLYDVTPGVPWTVGDDTMPCVCASPSPQPWDSPQGSPDPSPHPSPWWGAPPDASPSPGGDAPCTPCGCLPAPDEYDMGGHRMNIEAEEQVAAGCYTQQTFETSASSVFTNGGSFAAAMTLTEPCEGPSCTGEYCMQQG